MLTLSSKSSALTAFAELGTNPLKSSGIDKGAFQGLKKLSYIRIADTNINAIPPGDKNSPKQFEHLTPKAFTHERKHFRNLNGDSSGQLISSKFSIPRSVSTEPGRLLGHLGSLQR